MATKMSMSRGGEDSIVGFNKKVANYTSYDSEDDYSEEEDFYDHYEPYEEEFDNGDYQPFNAEDEEKEYYKARISPSFIKVFKPIFLNSPTKSAEKSPTKSPTWWDKNKPIEESKRMINGVLNYALLLPPPTPKPVVVPQQVKKSKKNKKGKDTTKQPTEKKVKNNDSTVPSKPTPKIPYFKDPNATPEVQKPTRFCLSIIKKTKCFHKAQCRFAHDYADLKECNFGEKCKKIKVVTRNPDSTVEMVNKNEAGCNFKHANESKNSYLKRVPQQHTSPRK